MATLAENRKAYHNYKILETLQAGLVLNGELYLVGATIPAWQAANASALYDPKRQRKLLLQKRELAQLIGKSRERGLTLIPLKIYTVKAKLKLELGVARGSKQHDKRDVLKKREAEREMARAFKMAG